jgi:hypothetical protein
MADIEERLNGRWVGVVANTNFTYQQISVAGYFNIRGASVGSLRIVGNPAATN